jgi:prepilin-type N-terminal cleavage/methylation domain-containing protein
MSSSSRRGFTLIEVLAAVALLGILYTVLARVAIEGLRAEGESQRRLEAMRIADDYPFDLELTPLVGLGRVHAIGRTEETVGDFTVTLEVEPFQIPAGWQDAEPPPVPRKIFVPGPDGRAPAVRTITLVVSWLEGAEARHIERTTYQVDFNSIDALVAARNAPPLPTPPPGGGASQDPARSRAPSEQETP